MVEAAAYAADRLAASLSTGGRGTTGGRLALRNGILAWWACEEGWRWPPNSRNNPGNIRPGLESSRAIGTDARNFLIFRTPRDGVDAFIDLILRGSPYQGIRTAIANILVGQAGSSALATAVGRSPWGTNAPCMLGAVVVAQAAGATPTGTNWAGGAPTSTTTSSPSPTATPAAAGANTLTMAELFRLVLGVDDAHVITVADAQRVGDWYARELAAGPQAGGPQAQSGEFMAGLRKLLAVYVGRRVGDLARQGISDPRTAAGSAESFFADIAAAIAGIPVAFGAVLEKVGYLVAILVIVILGLWLLVRSE